MAPTKVIDVPRFFFLVFFHPISKIIRLNFLSPPMWINSNNLWETKLIYVRFKSGITSSPKTDHDISNESSCSDPPYLNACAYLNLHETVFSHLCIFLIFFLWFPEMNPWPYSFQQPYILHFILRPSCRLFASCFCLLERNLAAADILA